MAFTGTSLLSLPIITTGTESGAWGNITNNGLTQYLDTSIAGALSITSSITLANTSGDASGTNLASTTAQYRTLVVPASGPSANIVITAPSSNRTYHVVNRNATYTVQIRAGANSGVTLDVNQSATVTYNSTSNDYELVGVVGSTTGTATATKFIPTGNVTAGNGMYLPAANTLAWSNNGSETMRIDSSGNVGIGTNSPSSKLSVVGAGYFQVAGGAGNYGTNITCYSGGGDIVLNTGTNSSGYAYQTVATNHAFVFGTNNTERARINASGQFLIGCTTVPNVGATPQQFGTSSSDTEFVISKNTNGPALYIKNVGGATATAISFYNATSNTGNITTTTSGTTSYNTSSDYRLKENIAPMTGALARVSTLKPVTYTWKADGSDGEGFIAHELAEVCPQAVVGEKDGEQMQSVDYGKLTPILTAALQEAIAKIETLEARIAVLEAK